MNLEKKISWYTPLNLIFSLHGLSEEVAEQREDIDNLDSRVTNTENDVTRIDETVAQQGDEIQNVKNEVNEQGERLDELKEVVDETVEKVEEIDHKVIKGFLMTKRFLFLETSCSHSVISNSFQLMCQRSQLTFSPWYSCHNCPRSKQPLNSFQIADDHQRTKMVTWRLKAVEPRSWAWLEILGRSSRLLWWRHSQLGPVTWSYHGYPGWVVHDSQEQWRHLRHTQCAGRHALLKKTVDFTEKKIQNHSLKCCNSKFSVI